MISKVLIATDGSTTARKAIEIGCDLAAKYEAEVVLLHVLLRGEVSENLRHMAEVEFAEAEGGQALAMAIAAVPAGRFPAGIDFGKSPTKGRGEMLRAWGEQILEAAETKAHSHGVTKVEKRIEDGDPAKRIMQAAQETKADLIVLGARGLSDLKSLLVGSVSHKVSHLAPVTCITVR
jgi:nucleotide-binding universal stress UspA family protein